MNENNLKNLLRNADQNAGKPSPVKVDISAIRRQARRKQIYRIVYPAAAAAIVILSFGIWNLSGSKTEPEKGPILLANEFEIKIKQLQASADETIQLIQEISKQEQRQKRLSELEAELASIPDPIEQINEQLDRTAFILVYSADKMYKELNLTDSAVETYKRVIKLFPENQWAQVARERLEEIKNRRNNNDSSKGESKWQQQNTLS